MSQPAVEFRNVTFAYPGSSLPALQSVTLSVAAGERLGILGPNGGGKSTLLKLAMGFLTCQFGEVLIFGGSPASARRGGMIGYVPQRADAEMGFPLSARQVIELGASWRLSPLARVGGEARRRVDHMVDLVGAAGFAHQPVGTLSGGQLQRTLIARALAAGPRMLVLDEPTVGIDAPGQAQFADLLRRVHRELGLTILIVSHDLRAIAAGCDRVACLARRLHSHTSPEGLTPGVLAELFNHDVAGLGGIHVHAHGPGETCPVDHAVPASGSGVVRLNTPRSQNPEPTG